MAERDIICVRASLLDNVKDVDMPYRPTPRSCRDVYIRIHPNATQSREKERDEEPLTIGTNPSKATDPRRYTCADN